MTALPQPDRRRLCLAALAALAAAGGVLPRRASAQSAASLASGRRAALVIGNGAYRVGPLKNPVGDAQAIADALRGLGFEVTLRQNAGLRDMLEAFRRFSLEATG